MFSDSEASVGREIACRISDLFKRESRLNVLICWLSKSFWMPFKSLASNSAKVTLRSLNYLSQSLLFAIALTQIHSCNTTSRSECAKTSKAESNGKRQPLTVLSQVSSICFLSAGVSIACLNSSTHFGMFPTVSLAPRSVGIAAASAMSFWVTSSFPLLTAA